MKHILYTISFMLLFCSVVEGAYATQTDCAVLSSSANGGTKSEKTLKNRKKKNPVVKLVMKYGAVYEGEASGKRPHG